MQTERKSYFIDLRFVYRDLSLKCQNIALSEIAEHLLVE